MVEDTTKKEISKNEENSDDLKQVLNVLNELEASIDKKIEEEAGKAPKEDEDKTLQEKKDDDSEETPPNTVVNQQQSAFAWKESGADFNEMASRRINRKKAEENEEKSKTSLKSNDGKKIAPKELMGAGLQKLKTKVKQNTYDDDEDENSYIIVGTLNDNSLADALTLEENKELKNQKENLTNKILQTAGKLEAVNNAEKLANQAGVTLGAKMADKNIASATYTMDQMTKTLNKDIGKELKIKNPGKIPASQHKELIHGIKKIKEKGGKVDNMKVDDVAKAGTASDKGVAEIIYKTANTADKKKIHQQTDVKHLIEKSGRASSKPTNKEKESNAVKQIEKGNVQLERPQKMKEQNGR
ncbi:MAG: hypothetical protein LBR70_00575 [Lactobacillaceae bacterium]|jgi:hypothetical protein|nr:hypothetical protein [Lactobacillaceae bacterium]